METKYSLKEIKNIVDEEGLEYTIMGYLSPSNVEDLELRKLFIQAEEALSKINSILENVVMEEDEDEHGTFEIDL